MAWRARSDRRHPPGCGHPRASPCTSRDSGIAGLTVFGVSGELGCCRHLGCGHPAPVPPTSRDSGIAGLPVFGVSGERGCCRHPPGCGHPAPVPRASRDSGTAGPAQRTVSGFRDNGITRFRGFRGTRLLPAPRLWSPRASPTQSRDSGITGLPVFGVSGERGAPRQPNGRGSGIAGLPFSGFPENAAAAGTRSAVVTPRQPNGRLGVPG